MGQFLFKKHLVKARHTLAESTAHLKDIPVAGNLNYGITEICCIFRHTIIQIEYNIEFNNQIASEICFKCAVLYASVCCASRSYSELEV